MKIKLKALYEVAQNASPGPWKFCSYASWGGSNAGDYIIGQAPDNNGDYLSLKWSGKYMKDAVHIITFNPATAQALINIIDEARGILNSDRSPEERLALLNSWSKDHFDDEEG